MSQKKEKKLKNQLKSGILEVLTKNPKKPQNYKQISKQLHVKDSKTRKEVIDLLEELNKSEKILEVRPGKFKLKPSRAYVEGIVDMTASGSAYVVTEELKEDVYISPKNLGRALHDDKVKVYLFAKSRRRKQEGQIVEILSRDKTDFVGTIEISKKFAFLIPDDKKMVVDIYIPLSNIKDAKNGQKAIARMTDWPEGASSPFGEIVEVLGDPGDNEVEMLSILSENGLPLSFPAEVDQAAGKLPVEITDEEIAKREDFREVTTFTIDPADAKDFDDALSFKKLKNGHYEVGVHIADVTHYVKEDSIIEEEAIERATSIYLVDRVIPMLPEKLSNFVCSLRPNEVKLCFSAIFEINEKAQIINRRFTKAVIRSDHRFVYDDVQEIIEGKEGKFKEEVLVLNDLAKQLRAKRMKKGSIAFESIEVRFNLDENGKPESVYFKESKEAHKLIEEFMLLANKSVAEYINNPPKGKSPKTFVYRVHDDPDPEKIQTFHSFIRKFGYQLNTTNSKVLSNSMNKLMDNIKGRPEENMIEKLAVRTMAKAYYSTENLGHYGLAFDYYSHFTSPIRRYPDMIAHRLLHRYLNKGKSANAEQIEELCKHASEMERKAVSAERESVKFFQVEFLKDKVGEEFDGVVSGVSEWGLFVELVENKCEGMIRLRDIDDDYYALDDENYQIVGNNSGRTFQIGDELRIRVKNADLSKKQLDFELVE